MKYQILDFRIAAEQIRETGYEPALSTSKPRRRQRLEKIDPSQIQPVANTDKNDDDDEVLDEERSKEFSFSIAPSRQQMRYQLGDLKDSSVQLFIQRNTEEVCDVRD